MLNENDSVKFVNPLKIISWVVLGQLGIPEISTPQPQVLIDSIINKTPESKSKAGTEKKSKNWKKPENYEKTSR